MYASTIGGGKEPFKPCVVIGSICYVLEQTYADENVALRVANQSMMTIIQAIHKVLNDSGYVVS